MTRTNPDALASTDWLHEHLRAPDVRIVDASYYLPSEGVDARAEFEKQHIPGAVFFDIDEIADTSSDLPHMMPPPEKFSAKVRKLGLGDGSRIVVYDQRGIFSAPRVWWMFRAMGHRDVAVLDGGLPKWLDEDKPVEDGKGRAGEERHFTARFDNTLLRDRDQVSREVTRQKEQIVDVRAPDGALRSFVLARTEYGAEARDAWIVVKRGHQNALRDLQGFDRMWVLFVFNYSRGGRTMVVPPRDGNPRGVFATRSPHRPNNIGMSCVRCLNVVGRKVLIRDHDLLHGTHVLDIKPYIPAYDSHPDAAAGWLDELEEPGPDHRWD